MTFLSFRERQRQVRKWQQQQRGRQNNYRHVQLKQRESSVTVRPDWIVIEEMEKTQLGKLSLPTVGEPEDLLNCGTMEYYDKAYDRVNVKNERPLKRIDRIFHTVTTTDDPIIRKLARTDEDASVFATDSILATLMCSGRSQYSWDIVVQKIGGKVFLDKRDNTEFGECLLCKLASSAVYRGNQINSKSSSPQKTLPNTFKVVLKKSVKKRQKVVFFRCYLLLNQTLLAGGTLFDWWCTIPHSSSRNNPISTKLFFVPEEIDSKVGCFLLSETFLLSL